MLNLIMERIDIIIKIICSMPEEPFIMAIMMTTICFVIGQRLYKR